MKKKMGKVLAVFLCLCTILTMADLPTRAYSEEGSAGAITMENHSLQWINGSEKTEIEGNTMTMTPSSNNEAWSMARVTYSCGGNEGVDTGKAEIRLPLYIYYDRNGKPIGTVELSIPEAPATGGATSFHYSIDDHGTEDPSDDEIVIKNYKPLQEGGFFMRADITWKYDVTQVASGYSNDQVQASFETQGNGGGDALTATSNSLTTTVSTSAKGSKPEKTVDKKYENWNSDWGPKPEDADDYYYVVWTVSETMQTTKTTAPYSLYIEEMPGAIDEDGNTTPGDKNRGEVVAWANYTGKNGAATANGTGKTTDYKLGTQVEMAAEPARVTTTLEEINNSYQASVYRNIVMRYPKSELQEEGDAPTIHNGTRIIIKTADGEITEKVALSSYTYERVSVGVPYPGDVFNMYKRQRAGFTSANTKISNSIVGGLSMLQAGKEIEADWSIDVKNMSWTRTQNGTKAYDTVLRDGNMYVAGEKLQPGDYELSRFYPAQYDIYLPGYNEDQGWFLGISGDYENAYAPIQVEVKDASGNWSEYGQIVKTGDMTYRWEGKDGTTSTGTFKSGSSTENKTGAILLPEGTQDIRFTHRGKAYGVEYRMGLYYKLKPSEHLLGLIGEDTTTFNLININEAWGAQDGAIYTPGNTLDLTSTPGIKADIESQDTEEFQATDRVMHDYAEHTFNAIKLNGTYNKKMSIPVNEKEAQRVKIPVTLTWDYYYNYSMLGMTMEDALDAELIAEAREAEFYDLLPAGVDVDLNSIKAQTYSKTNCDGKVIPDCEYTVELVENWRDSGRTMMILHVKVPDGYRNFAMSTSYCNTGFRVTFNMYDSWDNIETNGTTLKNDSAFVSLDGSVPGGVSNTGVGSADQSLFENLGDRGGDQELKNNVKYSSTSQTVDVPRAAQMGFSKKVKGAADVGYSSSTTVPATGEYSYQMRYALQDRATARGLVLYDVLETAYDQKPHWAGTFEGVNVASIRQQYPEVDVKVYYSTSKAFGNLQATSGIDYTDLTNTELWSTTAPDDLSKVTAVAVDLSKKKDGSEYTFTGPVALSATIQMRAPANYQDYVDDPTTKDTDETVYAYNQAFMKQGGERPEGSETTTVSLKKPEVSIEKDSNPFNGTQSNPKAVVVGSTINYLLKVRNKNGADAITGVKVEDIIPDGLEIDQEALAYYFGASSKNPVMVEGSGHVSATVEGQKVTFTIDKLSAKGLINLIIPVKVKEENAGGTRFDNQAKITEFNEEDWGDEYESNETHHSVMSANLALPVLKKFTGQTRPTKKTFEFTLTGVDGAPMPESANGDTVRITDGTTLAKFATIEFTKPGDYQYTVAEVDGGETGYTYDTTVHHITVHVAEENGRLVTTWTDAEAKPDEKNQITFTNDYTPISTEFSIPIEKILQGGKPAKDETFTFTLTGEGDAPMPENATVEIVGAGTTKSGAMVFTEVGIYKYTVAEVPGDATRYTYDAHVYEVEVTVTDCDGVLEATWTVDGKLEETATFTNTYTAPKTEVTKPTGGINTGDHSNMGLWLALAGTAVLALLVLVALRRKSK